MMERVVESSHIDARWRADAVLATGKQIRKFSDWKPAHWDRDDDREALIRQMRNALENIADTYGVEAEGFTIVVETRKVRRVTETETREALFSQHYTQNGDANR